MIIVEQDMLGSLLCSFKYYPDYITRMKSIKGQFDPTTKKWILPQSQFSALKQTFAGELYFKTPEWEIEGTEPPDYSHLYSFTTSCDTSKLGFKINPFNYQVFGIKFLVDRLETLGMSFIADAPGLGKTLQAMGAFKYMFDNGKVKNLIIVCKKSIKHQWQKEINKFLNHGFDIYIADDNKKKREKTYEEIKNNPKPTILIANYHLLLNDSDLIKKRVNPEMVCYDEVHTAKKYNGEINKACRAITKSAKYCLFMTGTPIMSEPADMYGIVSIKDNKYFGPFKDFHNRYIVEYWNGRYKNTVGVKNLDELRGKIQNMILRRTSGEVSIDLPEVLEINKECKKDAVQEAAMQRASEKSEAVEAKIDSLKKKYKAEDDAAVKQKIYVEIQKFEASLKGLIAVEQIIANSPYMLCLSKSKMIKHDYADVTPPLGYYSDKMIILLDIIETIRDAGQKVVCFTKYETVAAYVVAYLAKNKIKSVMYSGSVNDNDRVARLNEFEYDDDCVAIIGTDAMAEGLNLNFASNLINIDLAYNIAIHNQRIGRITRAGSKHTVSMVYNLITEDSIDQNIYNKIEETRNTFNGFVEVDKAQSELLKQLNN